MSKKEKSKYALAALVHACMVAARIKRPLFAIAQLEKPGFASFHFFKSNAPSGVLRSGRPFVCVNSTGTLKCYDSHEAMLRIENMLRCGWVDQLDKVGK